MMPNKTSREVGNCSAMASAMSVTAPKTENNQRLNNQRLMDASDLVLTILPAPASSTLFRSYDRIVSLGHPEGTYRFSRRSGLLTGREVAGDSQQRHKGEIVQSGPGKRVSGLEMQHTSSITASAF